MRIAILLLTLLIISCDDNSKEDILSIPLTVGNTWEYSMPSGSLGLSAEYSAKFHREVISTRIFNGITYYELDEYYTWSGSNEIYDYSSGKWFLSNVPDSGISSIFTDQAFNIVARSMIYDPAVKSSTQTDSSSLNFSNNTFTLDNKVFESVTVVGMANTSSGTLLQTIEIAPDIGIVYYHIKNNDVEITRQEIINYTLVD